jgi:PAS domain S-box-containing protein
MDNSASGSLLLSETNEHGTITMANDAFCEVSKYTREELLGKPHNLIRHPDMPKELFKHLWQTITTGKVFRGIIKNKAKDGAPYWVQTTIMPHEHDGETKYLSVRYIIHDHNLAASLFKEEATQYLNL